MKRWAIDTNVVVSGLLSSGGPCASVLDGVTDGRVMVVYDARILAEYRDVLCRPRLGLKPAHAVPDRTIVTANLAHFPARILRGARILTPVKALAEMTS